MIAACFISGSSPVISRRVVLKLREEAIVSPLNELVSRHADVSFGSYPVTHTNADGDVHTIITLDAAAADGDALDAALSSLLGALPDGAVTETSGGAVRS